MFSPSVSLLETLREPDRTAFVVESKQQHGHCGINNVRNLRFLPGGLKAGRWNTCHLTTFWSSCSLLELILTKNICHYEPVNGCLVQTAVIYREPLEGAERIYNLVSMHAKQATPPLVSPHFIAPIMQLHQGLRLLDEFPVGVGPCGSAP